MNRYTDLPDRALSIRQPWIWAILNAGKAIENRPRRFNYRGPICLHASLYRPANGDYEDCLSILSQIHGCFTMGELVRQNGRESSTHYSTVSVRGGIIGTAEIVDCVEDSDSPWFFGPFGLVLENVKPVERIPVKGALGLFKWKERL